MSRRMLEKTKNGNINNKNSMNVDPDSNHSSNTVDYTVKNLYLHEECLEARTDHHDFTECCQACHANVHRLSVKKFSDIEIDENGPMYCNKVCRAGFPEVTPDMTADSDKTQRDENGKRFRIWIRKQQQDDSKELAGSGMYRSRVEYGTMFKPFFAKIFPKSFREETKTDESQYEISTGQRSLEPDGLVEKRTSTVKRRQVQPYIVNRWVVSYTLTLRNTVLFHINVALYLSRLGRI